MKLLSTFLTIANIPIESIQIAFLLIEAKADIEILTIELDCFLSFKSNLVNSINGLFISIAFSSHNLIIAL